MVASVQRASSSGLAAASPAHAAQAASGKAAGRGSLLRLLVSEIVGGVNRPRPRYSVHKLARFTQYRRCTSVWRQAGVILVTPLPMLLVSLLPTLIPLQDPTLGIQGNSAFALHFFVTLGAVSVGGILQIRAATGISHAVFPTRDVVLISVIAVLSLLAGQVAVAYAWRFPVPFTWAVMYPVWVSSLVWGCYAVLRGRLHALKGPMLAFLPSFFVQGSQVLFYPAFSALYEASNAWQQIALTCVFPLLKFWLKVVVFHLSHSVGGMQPEVSVTGIEIAASMYQAMIMRGVPVPFATALVIGLDVAMSLIAVLSFMSHRSVVRPRELLARAISIVEADPLAISDQELEAYSSIKRLPALDTGLLKIAPSPGPRRSMSSALTAVAAAPPPSLAKESSATASREPSKRQGSSRQRLKLVTQALEALQAAEIIVLVEYIEVAVPLANALFLTLASQNETAIYNPVVQPFYHDATRLEVAIGLLVQYTLLQQISVVAVAVGMWAKYRLSAMTLLAFVLEEHAWSLQGKFLAWFGVMFHFPVLHYGVDFTFRFDFAVRRAASGGPSV